ncbi:MAG: hypothetical protein ACKOEM_08220 [Planctomycetia bacterium]
MNLRALDAICFAICLGCIVVGVAMALVMIWTPGISETLWRLLATIGVVFFGAASTLSVSRTFGRTGRSDNTSDG